jgi:hypothetical protein
MDQSKNIFIGNYYSTMYGRCGKPSFGEQLLMPGALFSCKPGQCPTFAVLFSLVPHPRWAAALALGFADQAHDAHCPG